MQAETEEARSEAIAKTTVRILETLQWLDDRSFMSSAQLGRWEHLVRTAKPNVSFLLLVLNMS